MGGVVICIISHSQVHVQRSSLQPFLVQRTILTLIIAVKCGQDKVQSHYKIVWHLCLFQRFARGKARPGSSISAVNSIQADNLFRFQIQYFFRCLAAQTTNLQQKDIKSLGYNTNSDGKLG